MGLMQAKVNNMDFSSCSQEEMDKELGEMLPKIYMVQCEICSCNISAYSTSRV